jgi:hypothetical protein
MCCVYTVGIVCCQLAFALLLLTHFEHYAVAAETLTVLLLPLLRYIEHTPSGANHSSSKKSWHEGASLGDT